MGLVFEAEQSDLKRRVAVKLLLDTDPVATDRFLQEAHATANLLSPNIVTVLDFKAKDGDSPPLIVMELLEGETLSDVLLREHRLPVARAVGIAVQMLNGLATAHRASVIHRDVKPANVFITEGPLGDVVKLVDFGIAKILTGDVRALTRKGVFPGTPAYVAPEQLRVENADARTDLYGVALVLFEMLTGRRPFMQTSFGDLAAAILREEPPPLRTLRPDAPAEIHALVARCLSKQRENRPKSAEEMLAALKPFAGGGATSSPGSAGTVPRKGGTVPMADAPRANMETRKEQPRPPVGDDDPTPLLGVRPAHYLAPQVQHDARGSQHDARGSQHDVAVRASRPDGRSSSHDAGEYRGSGHDLPPPPNYIPSPPPMRAAAPSNATYQEAVQAPPMVAPHPASQGAIPMSAPMPAYGMPPPYAAPPPAPGSAGSISAAMPASAPQSASGSYQKQKPTVMIKGKAPLAPPLELPAGKNPAAAKQGTSSTLLIVVGVSALFALVGVALILFAVLGR